MSEAGAYKREAQTKRPNKLESLVPLESPSLISASKDIKYLIFITDKEFE